jgi:hypothetical protein
MPTLDGFLRQRSSDATSPEKLERLLQQIWANT